MGNSIQFPKSFQIEILISQLLSDTIQNNLLRFFLQMDIASLGDMNKARFYFILYRHIFSGEECPKF